MSAHGEEELDAALSEYRASARFQDKLHAIEAERDRQVAVAWPRDLWLGVVPWWTPRLLEAMEIDESAIRALVEHRLAERRVVEAPAGREPRPGRRVEPVRYAVGPQAKSRLRLRLEDRTLEAKLQALADLGRRLSGVTHSDELEQLSGLAAELGGGPEAASRRLVEEVRGTLGGSATVGHAAPIAEAYRWLTAARALDGWIDGGLSAAVRSAERFVRLAQRHLDDRRRLGTFVLREPQWRAVEALLDRAATAPWALHLLGHGGMGKTMLVRHVVSKLAPERGYAVARVDFDYLDPDYPGTRPWLLVEHLVEQLSLADIEGAAVDAFELLVERIDELRPIARTNRLSARERYREDGLVERFASALAQLGRPVLLVFDTCEELAQLAASDALPPSLAETFGLIEAVKEVATDLRVLFSGRRPIASGGHGSWRREVDYPARAYLALHAVAPFGVDEAKALLARFYEAEGFQGLPPSRLAKGLLARARLERGEPGGYNPFELALFAQSVDWSAPDAPVQTSDEYVRVRIVERIRHQGARALLPVIAWAPRFDEALLRGAFVGSDAEFADAFRELTAHEFVDQNQDAFAFEPRLLGRLRRYFANHEPEALEAAGIALRRRLPDRTEAPGADAPVFHYEAAFLSSLTDVDRAERWWTRVEANLRRERDAAWIRRLVSRLGHLLEPEIELPLPMALGEGDRRRLRAALQVALASLRGHERYEAWEDWFEAARDGSPSVRLRALAGRIHAARWSEVPDQQVDSDRLLRDLEAQLDILGGEVGDEHLAGILAAVEWTLDSPFVGTPEVALVLARRCARRARGRSLELTAFARLLVARGYSATGRAWVSRRFREAVDAAREHREAAEAARRRGRLNEAWLDWAAPSDLEARARLEWAQHALRRSAPPGEVLALIDIGAPRRAAPANVDADRLLGLGLALKAALAPLEPEWTNAPIPGSPEAVSQLELHDLVRRPAHQGTRPSAVVRLLERGRRGELEDAEEGLRALARLAIASERAPDYAREVDHARGTLRLELRTGTEWRHHPGLLDRLRQRDGVLFATLLDVEEGMGPHRWRPATSQPRVDDAPTREGWLGPDVERLLDEVVAARMVGERSEPDAARALTTAILRFAGEAMGPRALRASFALRLRQRALVARPGVRRVPLPRSLEERIGPRMAARIALDEGQQIARIDPAAAGEAFEMAKRLFEAVRDGVGAYLAGASAVCLLPRNRTGPWRSTLEASHRELRSARRLVARWEEITGRPDGRWAASLDEPLRGWILRLALRLNPPNRIQALRAWAWQHRVPSTSFPGELERILLELDAAEEEADAPTVGPEEVALSRPRWMAVRLQELARPSNPEGAEVPQRVLPELDALEEELALKAGLEGARHFLPSFAYPVGLKSDVVERDVVVDSLRVSTRDVTGDSVLSYCSTTGFHGNVLVDLRAPDEEAAADVRDSGLLDAVLTPHEAARDEGLATSRDLVLEVDGAAARIRWESMLRLAGLRRPIRRRWLGRPRSPGGEALRRFGVGSDDALSGKVALDAWSRFGLDPGPVRAQLFDGDLDFDVLHIIGQADHSSKERLRLRGGPEGPVHELAERLADVRLQVLVLQDLVDQNRNPSAVRERASALYEFAANLATTSLRAYAVLVIPSLRRELAREVLWGLIECLRESGWARRLPEAVAGCQGLDPASAMIALFIADVVPAS